MSEDLSNDLRQLVHLREHLETVLFFWVFLTLNLFKRALLVCIKKKKIKKSLLMVSLNMQL